MSISTYLKFAAIPLGVLIATAQDSPSLIVNGTQLGPLQGVLLSKVAGSYRYSGPLKPFVEAMGGRVEFLAKENALVVKPATNGTAAPLRSIDGAWDVETARAWIAEITAWTKQLLFLLELIDAEQIKGSSDNIRSETVIALRRSFSLCKEALSRVAGTLPRLNQDPYNLVDFEMVCDEIATIQYYVVGPISVVNNPYFSTGTSPELSRKILDHAFKGKDLLGRADPFKKILLQWYANNVSKPRW